MAGFEAPADEAIAQVQANEPGTVVFQWNSNGAKVELHERFADKRR
jgi:hypothetical protein